MSLQLLKRQGVLAISATMDVEAVMQWLRRWEQLMEDIEDPRGSEQRRLRDRVRALEEQLSDRAAVNEAHPL
jgi:protein-tyrosine-phosphatase